MKTSNLKLKTFCFYLLISWECIGVADAQNVLADDLIGIIKKEQGNAVKESFSEGACCCFTWDDHSAFSQNQVPQKIVKRLRTDLQFNSVVSAIKKLPSQKWELLKNKALITRRPTWREQGSISSTGTTDAGKKAEESIAKAIVDLVIELKK